MLRIIPILLLIAAPIAALGRAPFPEHDAYWDTVNLFAYRRLPSSELPERVDLEFPESRGFRAPAVGRIWSRYGRRGGRDHNGIDIDVALDQPIYSAFDGVVRLSKYNAGGFGHLIIIRHANGLETYYSHLSKRIVAAGDLVLAGQTIGLGGRSGRASAVHLHFETRYCDQSFDPERIIDFDSGELRGRLFALCKEHFSIGSNVRDGAMAANDAADNEAEGVEAHLAAQSSRHNPASQTELAALAHPGQQIDPSIAVQPHPDAERPFELQKSESNAESQTESKSEKEEIYHKIKSGDTLLALAMEYRTTVARICQLNGIKRSATLRIGRNLRIL